MYDRSFVRSTNIYFQCLITGDCSYSLAVRQRIVVGWELKFGNWLGRSPPCVRISPSNKQLYC